MADLPRSMVAPQTKNDPAQWVFPGKPLAAVTILFSAMVLVTGYLAAERGGMGWTIAYLLTCVTLGLIFTLAGTAWGALVALTESPKCGLWFILFPPYMFYYAATRWRWMVQPAVLFLSGMGLAIGGILGGKQLLARLDVP